MSSFRHSLKLITPDYWVLMGMLFIMKVGQFMMLPFLAIYLSAYAHIDPATIGMVVGVGPFVYGISSLFAGVFVDRYGIRAAIASSLFFSGVTIYFFFYQNSIVWFLMMSALTGASRSFFDVGFKSYKILELTPDTRKLYLSLRYMVINSAAAVGPVLGAYFTTINSNLSFKVVGVAYLVLCGVSLIVIRGRSLSAQSGASRAAKPILNLILIIKKDRALLMLVFIAMIFWVVYSQMDSTLAQYLHSSLTNGVGVYSLMLIINALGCASLQVLVTHLTKNIEEKVICIYAMSLFAAGYILIALFLNLPVLVLASLLIVIAETLTMPLNDFLIAKIAPPHLIGTYYGATGLAMLGLGIGPMIGGGIYQAFGAPAVFILCGLLCFASIYLYRKLLYSISMNSGSGSFAALKLLPVEYYP